MNPLVALVFLLSAYVMPASSILRRQASARDDLTITSARFEGTATVAPVLARQAASDLGMTWTSGQLTATAVFSMRLPGRCRLELSTPESGTRVSAVWNHGKRRLEGGELAPAQVALDQACALLALHSATEGESRAALERHLQSLAVDTRTTSLARFAGTIALVVGSRSEGGQMWVYKDTFQPARVRFTDERGSWDVRFIDYGAQATGEWFPRLIEVYRGDALQVRLTTLSADGKAKLEGVVF